MFFVRTNWEREGVLDFVLHLVIIALISIFSLFFFSWKTELDKSSSSITIFTYERVRGLELGIDKSRPVDISSSINSCRARLPRKLNWSFTSSPRKSERPRARYRQIEAGWHIELDKLVSSSVAQITKLIPNCTFHDIRWCKLIT